MTQTRTRTELPAKYDVLERKRGRSRTAVYKHEGDKWVCVLDLDLTGERRAYK